MHIQFSGCMQRTPVMHIAQQGFSMYIKLPKYLFFYMPLGLNDFDVGKFISLVIITLDTNAYSLSGCIQCIRVMHIAQHRDL
jgi:hypothetical protein